MISPDHQVDFILYRIKDGQSHLMKDLVFVLTDNLNHMYKPRDYTYQLPVCGYLMKLKSVHTTLGKPLPKTPIPILIPGPPNPASVAITRWPEVVGISLQFISTGTEGKTTGNLSNQIHYCKINRRGHWFIVLQILISCNKLLSLLMGSAVIDDISIG